MAQVDTNFPKVRRMLFYFSPLISGYFLASLHAASRAHRSCHSVSSWDRSSNFWALGLRWWGSPGQIIPRDGVWSQMSAWRNTASVNRTHRIGFSMFELFRKIVEDFGGSISWNTQPNCRVTFNIATALLSPFFRPFARLFVYLAVCVRALFTISASIFGLVEQAFWRMQLFTEWSGASSFEVILARQSSHFPTWASASKTPGSRCIFHTLLRRRSRRRIRLCRFARFSNCVGNCMCLLLTTARLLSIANNLLDFFVHAVLPSDSWPRRLFKISISGLKIHHS